MKIYCKNLLLEFFTDVREYGVNLREFILMCLGVPGLVKDLHGFLFEKINLALTGCDHSLNVFAIDVIYICDAMISMFANSASEAYTDLTVPAVSFDFFAGMLPACFI